MKTKKKTENKQQLCIRGIHQNSILTLRLPCFCCCSCCSAVHFTLLLLGGFFLLLNVDSQRRLFTIKMSIFEFELLLDFGFLSWFELSFFFAFEKMNVSRFLMFYIIVYWIFNLKMLRTQFVVFVSGKYYQRFQLPRIFFFSVFKFSNIYFNSLSIEIFH